ncbi:glycoside hydrolase family 10 protein [Deminuibacter soli]|uniref:Glycosyl hydrolase-like 10 domain-containing protein n=1 Tax=Deminuibacter soli TaxID=2291815 RepID=A0A3E1NCN0_9BACT|nr:family 10 glycosylhydrolase [Deminuibacter soli]RFM25765.1 hypothetical protein DXN05_23335 [Deminuibacter soli]
MLRTLIPALLLCLLYSCGSHKAVQSADNPVALPALPQAEREFRAAWVATVGNIDWPGKPGLTTAQQQAEAIALLDYLQDHHFNAVIFQVRPQADALYKSDLEPWSYWLTGTQGKAPSPYYDPLEFWVKEAHDRGLELHVWLNPYRAHHREGKEISDQSVVKKHPDWVVHLKQDYWWMDPANKQVQDYTAAVVKDLVKRYDIDGVHMDDYFYPYLEYNNGEDFPDNDSWSAYQKSGGKLSRADWRRDNVNTLIERLYKVVKSEKKTVKFGISPFGIWKPGYPASIEGFSQYDQLYADAKLWLNKGWLDYFTPQLYWPINKMPQSFPVLLGWWKEQNTQQRHLWPGMSVGRDTAFKTVNETLSQLMITRGMLPHSMGAVHWNLQSDVHNTALSKALLDGPYKKNALVPASTWLSDAIPAAPKILNVIKRDGAVTIGWAHPNEAAVFRWVVYYKYGSRWNYTIYNRNDRSVTLPLSSADKTPAKLTQVLVTAVDRTGNESARTKVSGQW